MILEAPSHKQEMPSTNKDIVIVLLNQRLKIVNIALIYLKYIDNDNREM